jgi:hypothetical protein
MIQMIMKHHVLDLKKELSVYNKLAVNQQNVLELYRNNDFINNSN